MWEYDVIWLGDPSDVEKVKGRLNDAGEGGWELVGVTHGFGFFKRISKQLVLEYMGWPANTTDT